MKIIYSLFTVLLLASCKTPVKTDLPVQTAITDTVATAEIDVIPETVIMVSEPFHLNKMLCYWKHTFMVFNEDAIEILMELKKADTRQTVFELEYLPKFASYYDYRSESYFEKFNETHFDDLNFDGHKDFRIYQYGSMPMTSVTAIYLFNSKAGTFEYAADLSDNTIEDIDPVNKILETSGFDMESVYQTKHFFDKNGKIKYTERTGEKTIEISDTEISTVSTYYKIIDGKIIETKTDTLHGD